MLKLGGFLSTTTEIYYHPAEKRAGSDIFKVFLGSLFYQGYVFDNEDLGIIWLFFFPSTLSLILILFCLSIEHYRQNVL